MIFLNLLSIFLIVIHIQLLGLAPDTFIAVGTEPKITKSTVHLISHGDGGELKSLAQYDGSKPLKLTLPDNITTKNIKWVSIWNKPTSASLGQIFFPGKGSNIHSTRRIKTIPGSKIAMPKTPPEINSKFLVIYIYKKDILSDK